MNRLRFLSFLFGGTAVAVAQNQDKTSTIRVSTLSPTTIGVNGYGGNGYCPVCHTKAPDWGGDPYLVGFSKCKPEGGNMVSCTPKYQRSESRLIRCANLECNNAFYQDAI